MLEQAVMFAAKAHRGQKRKGTSIPYIVHPMEVGAIAAGITEDDEIIAAAVLHDVLEDCDGYTYTQLEQEFGAKVASLVAMESEDKSKSWAERKQHTIDFLNHEATREMKIIALSDKLANIRSLKRDYMKVGDDLWLRFNEKDKRKQGWYYINMLSGLEELSEYSEYQEYKRLVKDVFGNVE